jgi:NAD(P)-dependent dehydrogenase (short-subunit alcohol dehydrogenase family)
VGKLDGKVAVVTGAARGQGRSHAVTLAKAGADIIALDICADIENVKYPLASPADLAETQRLVEKEDRRCVTYQADVREPAQVRAAVDGGVAELGRLDIVVANAGIAPLGASLPGGAFLDSVNVNFLGVVNAVTAAYPHLRAGASIIATGSVAAMFRGATDLNQQGPVRARPGNGSRARVDQGQRRPPGQREHRHAAQPGDVQGLPAGT